MTDITELAQSLKAAAIDAKELAIIARYSKGRAAAEKFYALANPNNIIALVEALEKEQQRISELDRKNSELDSLTQRWAVERAENAERIDELDAELEREREISRRVMSRIAELESRTVTINTPDARDEDYDWDDQTPSEAFNTCRRICALMFRQSLRTAGIKVEAE